jgi:6,7-dimethyl-8-ribityllumazine synthase
MLVRASVKDSRTQDQYGRKEEEKNMAKETIRIGAVVSDFNYDITMMMLERAKEHAEFLGAEITKVVKVPGVFDMGLAVKKLLTRKDIDGVITIGAVIEGETEHDDLVIQHAARKIADLALEYDKPVGLGISGPGMTRLQAEDRIERGKAAVEAVVKLHQRLQNI